MKHPSTKPTVCRTDKELRLNPIYHATRWLLWQRWSCRSPQPPGPFPSAAAALAGSGAGSIHPAARAGERCWLSPLHHLTDQRPPVRHWYLPSCSIMGLQGQSPDTALALKPPAPGDEGLQGTRDPALHFEPAPRGSGGDRGRGRREGHGTSLAGSTDNAESLRLHLPSQKDKYLITNYFEDNPLNPLPCLQVSL